MLFWGTFKQLSEIKISTLIVIKHTPIYSKNFFIKFNFFYDYYLNLFKKNRVFYLHPRSFILRKRKALVQPPVSIYLNRYHWTIISHRVFFLELEEIEIWDLYEGGLIWESSTRPQYITASYKLFFNTGNWLSHKVVKKFYIYLGWLDHLITQCKSALLKHPIMIKQSLTNSTNFQNCTLDTKLYYYYKTLFFYKIFSTIVYQHYSKKTCLSSITPFDVIVNDGLFLVDRAVLYYVIYTGIPAYKFSLIPHNKDYNSRDLSKFFFFFFEKNKFNIAGYFFRGTLKFLLTKSKLQNFLVIMRRTLSLSTNFSKNIAITLTCKKKFIGVVISSLFFKDLISGLSVFLNLASIRKQYRVLFTSSSALVAKLFFLTKDNKLRPIIFILLSKLVRRYLIILNTYKINIFFKNYNQNISYFWKHLFNSDNTIINHPTFFFLIADVSFNFKKFKHLPYKKLIAEYINYLLSLESDIKTIISKKVDNNQLSNIYKKNFSQLFSNLIRREVFIFKKNFSEKLPNQLEIQNFLFECCFIELTNNLKNALNYKKKIKSIKRRISKRITKETYRRVWPF